jgi:hypothetical protein
VCALSLARFLPLLPSGDLLLSGDDDLDDRACIYADRCCEGWEGFPLPPAAECGIWRRFALYVDTICRRCLDAGVDCGCDDGLGNPAVGEMMRYIERTVATVQHAAPNGPLPRVVVQVSGRLGNQIFSTVNALILAMFSQRALVMVASGKQQYEPDSVFDIGSAIAHVPCGTSSVLSLAHMQGYENLALEDWSFDGASSEVECIFLEEIMEDPYLWFVNAGVGQFLADSFSGRHFFFLSHFIYLGFSPKFWGNPGTSVLVSTEGFHTIPPFFANPVMKTHPTTFQNLLYSRTFQSFARSVEPLTDKVSSHHYHYLYDEFLPHTGHKVKLLEIGLGCNMDYGPGASAQVWRKMYPEGDIYFVEYDGECVRKWQSRMKDLNVTVFVGSQSDVNFLQGTVLANGPYDIIIDDGGHSDREMLTSLFTLIEGQAVTPGGLYVIEDMGCNHETGESAKQRYRDNQGIDYANKGMPKYLANAPIHADGSLRPFAVFQMWIEELSAEAQGKATLATRNFNYVGCASGACFIRFLKTSQPPFFV